MIERDESVLITGGTGSFGHAMVRALLGSRHLPRRVIVFSRDEFKQGEMAREFGDHPHLRFFIGDVRDGARLERAFHNVQHVFHAAALKQVPSCEYNPWEAVRTNIHGASNVIDAAVACGVKRVVALSSDKAVNPINLYGATKLVSEKLFVAANAIGARRTRFSVVRYGNVLASRGSVVPLFAKQIKNENFVNVTDKRMTRFWWTVEQAVRFVLDVNERMVGGEVFLPKLGSSTILRLVEAIASVEGMTDFKVEWTGIRPGEKLHEVLMAPDEVPRTHDLGWCYTVYPALKFFNMDDRVENPVGSEFRYCSDAATLSMRELAEMLVSIGGL